MEDQVTYPLLTSLQGTPGVKTIRATSMFGMSFIYLIFDDNTDPYWARSRVLEKLNYAQRLLPQGVTPTMGPDGTGAGHVLWYTLSASGMDLGEQRALQDWYVKLALQTVPGVAEVASFGGMQKEYQVIIDPLKMQYYGYKLMDIALKVRAGNNDVGGAKLEMNGTAYVIRGLGYAGNQHDLENILLGFVQGVPVRLKDIASVQFGSSERVGIVDLNGRGEAVGGIVVMRSGENADKVIRAVKEKMQQLAPGLPGNVKLHIAYDRSSLIESAIHSVTHTLFEEMITVSFVVLLFLFNWRSALVILIQMPFSVVVSFSLLQFFHISSNIMSLTGIALAIGVIVDDGIVMTENAYRKLSEPQKDSGKINDKS